MDRLTNTGTKEAKLDVTITEALNKLAEYEDAGLTPEQIKELDRLYQEKCREVAKYQKYDTLRQQGRMPVLPCTAGQKVYVISRNPLKIISGEVASIRISTSASSLRIYVPESGQYISRLFEQTGRSVFFSQAVAEQELAKIKGAGKLVLDDAITINGREYSKKNLCLDWFRMSNDSFFNTYGFNFNPHEYSGLYDWGKNQIYGSRGKV